MVPVLCKDCQHFEPQGYCNLAACQRVSVITGQHIYDYNWDTQCAQVRKGNWLVARLFGRCGREGRFFNLPLGKKLERCATCNTMRALEGKAVE